MQPPRLRPQLRDPRQATTHLETFVDPRHFATYTALIVLCDDRSEPLLHVEVHDCDADPTPSECAAVVDGILGRLPPAGGSRLHGVLVALTRPGGEGIQPSDGVWFRAIHRVCHSRGLTAHGVYVVGRHGARPIHVDDAA